MKKNILIVEDEMHIRTLLRRALEMSFEDQIDDEILEILEARTGEEGINMANSEKPELVFLDVMMPIMDGYTVCRKIKEDPKISNTYVIMLTAKGQEIDREKGLAAGTDEYITKPFDPDEIITKVEEQLGIKRSI